MATYCSRYAHRWLTLLLLLIGLSVLTVSQSYAAPPADGSIYLPIVTNGKGSAPPVRPTPVGGPSSEGKISAALQKGEIDAETALLYRVYASFEDPRLPSHLVGDDTNIAPSNALRDVQARWSTLSAATQQTLAPFLLPPNVEGSWLTLRAAAGVEASTANRITWSTTCQSDPNIKVWYQDRFPEDADDARLICEEVSSAIWPRFNALMRRTPPTDAGQNNNGGDGRLDIYLAPAKTAAVTYQRPFNSPSYLLINHRQWSKPLLANAMMRAFLHGYVADWLEYAWLYDITSTWAVDYAYPNENEYEHPLAKIFLNHTDLSVDNISHSSDLWSQPEGKLGASAYLWMWYLTNWVTTPQALVPQVWEKASNPNSLATVNEVLGDNGFEQHWKEFSVHNWNHAPVDNYARSSDKLAHHTKLALDVTTTISATGDNSYPLDGAIASLAAKSYRFAFVNPDVRSVLFINPFHDNAEPTARVSALIKVEGQEWQREDWTPHYGRGFCRDLKAERLEELVIVISNHEWQMRRQLQPAYPPRLNVTNVACRGWQVESKVTSVEEGDQLNRTTVAETSFTFVPLAAEGGVKNHPYFEAVDGSGFWRIDHTHTPCHGKGMGAFALTGKVYSSFFHVHTYATDPATGTTYQPGLRGYTGFAGSARDWAYRYVCPSQSYEFYADLPWFHTDAEPVLQVKEDGKTITGKYIRLQSDNVSLTTTTWEWKMTALPPE